MKTERDYQLVLKGVHKNRAAALSTSTNREPGHSPQPPERRLGAGGATGCRARVTGVELLRTLDARCAYLFSRYYNRSAVLVTTDITISQTDRATASAPPTPCGLESLQENREVRK